MTEQVFLMGTQGGQQGGGGFLAFLPFILIFVIIYFLMLRPQQKRQKAHQRLLTELKKGDRVVTNGGMFGTIAGFNEKENVVVLKIDDNTKVELLRSSIAGRIEKGSS